VNTRGLRPRTARKLPSSLGAARTIRVIRADHNWRGYWQEVDPSVPGGNRVIGWSLRRTSVQAIHTSGDRKITQLPSCPITKS